MTPEYIRNSLFYFSDVIHQFHQDTKLHAEHETLGGFYESLLKFRDEIPEKLMGYQGGKAIGKIKMKEFPDYTAQGSIKMCNEIIAFAYDLYKWAGQQKYCDIENKAQELSGEVVLTIYRLNQK